MSRTKISKFVIRHYKGQAAIEFYTLLTMFLLVLAVVMSIFLSIAATESRRYDSYSVDETAGRFADIVHASYIAGNGFNGTFDVPTDIDGADYEVHFKEGTVIIVSHSYDRDLISVRPLVTINITDTLTGSDSFTYTSAEMGGQIHVFNVNGTLNMSR